MDSNISAILSDLLLPMLSKGRIILLTLRVVTRLFDTTCNHAIDLFRSIGQKSQLKFCQTMIKCPPN